MWASHALAGFLLSIFYQGSSAATSCYNGGAPTVTIEIGEVHGTTTSLPAATATVNKFLGIPFAKTPPTRFALPEKAALSAQPINATSWKAACPQQFVYPQAAQAFTEQVFNNPPPEESEDCLYLNVYAPSTPAPCDGRPVLFWIYGGAWQFGNAGQQGYDGSNFAAYEDVIVVTFNYRANVFGFPTTPELPIKERNLGLLDQHFALDWVQRNIHAWGGSPKKVTIFGESAGAWSIDAAITSYSKNDAVPFRAAIMQSGQISYNAQPRPSTFGSWYRLAANLSCPGAYESNITCIRAASAKSIQAFIDEESVPFFPTWDNHTLYVNAARKRLDGNIPQIPILTGSTSQEGRVFNVGQNDSRPFLEQITANTTALINAIISAYPLSAPDSGPTPYDQLSQIWTDYIFGCTGAFNANASAAAGIPTWRYYFNASFANTQPDVGRPLGAFHSSEISIVFGTYPSENVTTQQYALSQTMRGAWAKFAKNPAGGPGWNPVGSGQQGSVLLGPSSMAMDGYYTGDETTALKGNYNMGIFGNRHNTLTGLTVIDSQEVDSRCALFSRIYATVLGFDQESAAEEAAASR